MKDPYKYDSNGNLLYHAVDFKKVNYATLYDENPEEWTPTSEDIACELQLLGLGDWEPLKFEFSTKEWNINQNNLKKYYTPFQPKEGILNDRHSVLIYGLEGDHPSRPTGLDQIRKELGYMPLEEEFKYPTKAHPLLTSYHPVFDFFGDIGRSFVLKLNAGGFYPYHRDFPFITRNTIRLIGFHGHSNNDQLEWEVAGQRQPIMPNTLYYVNTMKRHRLSSWKHNSDMVVLNIPKTWTNVLKLMSVLNGG